MLACGCCDNNDQADKVLIELVNNGEAAPGREIKRGFFVVAMEKSIIVDPNCFIRNCLESYGLVLNSAISGNTFFKHLDILSPLKERDSWMQA